MDGKPSLAGISFGSLPEYPLSLHISGCLCTVILTVRLTDAHQGESDHIPHGEVPEAIGCYCTRYSKKGCQIDLILGAGT
jgi:hypothetical protein